MAELPASGEFVELVRTAADGVLGSQMGAGYEVKADASLVTATDVALQSGIREALAGRWPQVRFLGEEMAADEQQALLDTGGPFWCLDPLDGTTNFVAGIPYYAVSLALFDGRRAVSALVYDPCRKECFSADRDGGAHLNGEPLRPGPVRPLDHSVALVDFKRLEAGLSRRLVDDPPYASQRNFGASALDWCWLAAGRGDIYLHGGQKLWDWSAGSLVLQEAGGIATTLEGEPFDDARLGARSVIAARDAGLFQQWRDWIA